MLDMLSEKRLDTTDLPRHLAQLVVAAEAAANAFRELDYAVSQLRDFPAEMRMPIETAAVQQWQAWQEIERRGGTLINEYRMREAENARKWWDGEKWVVLDHEPAASY